jgi:hypothetical protein
VLIGNQKSEVNCRLLDFLSWFRDVSGKFLQIFFLREFMFHFHPETLHSLSGSNLEMAFSWSVSPFDANPPKPLGRTN